MKENISELIFMLFMGILCVIGVIIVFNLLGIPLQWRIQMTSIIVFGAGLMYWLEGTV